MSTEGSETDGKPDDDKQEQLKKVRSFHDSVGKTVDEPAGGGAVAAGSVLADAASEFQQKPIVPHQDLEPPPDAMARVAGRMERLGVAVVLCWDDELAMNLAHAIRNGGCLGSAQWRLIAADQLRDLPEPAHSFETLTDMSGAESEEVFVVSLFDDAVETHIRRLLGGLSDARAFGSRLRACRRRVLVLTFPHLAPGPAAEGWDEVAETLDYLDPLWRLYQATTRTDPQLVDLLRDQIARGVWGAEPRVVFERVKSDCRNGDLAERIAQVRENPESRPILLSGEDGRRLVQKIEHGTEPESTILFAATFFGRLGPRDFEDVIRSLLGERAYQRAEDAESEDGSGKTGQRSVRRRHIEDYDEAPMKYLKLVGITPLADSNRNAMVIGFNIPYMGRELELYFMRQGVISFNRYFSLACEAKLIFSPSKPIASKFMDLAAQAARLDDLSQGQRWLTGLLWAAVRGLPSGMQEGGESLDPAAGLDELVTWLRNAKAEHWERFCQLLQRLCEDEYLADLTASVVRQRIEKGEYGIALALLKGIRHHRNFDTLSWLWRIFDHAPASDRADAVEFFGAFLMSSGRWLVDYIDRIGQFLPAHDVPWSRYSLAQQYASRQVVQTLLDVCRQFDGREGRRGHLLVDTCVSTQPKVRAPLVRVLTHPGVRAYLARYVEAEARLLGASPRDSEMIEVYYRFFVRASLLAARTRDDMESERSWSQRLPVLALSVDLAAPEDLLPGLGRFLLCCVVSDDGANVGVVEDDINRFAQALPAWIVAECYNELLGVSAAAAEGAFDAFLADLRAALDRGGRSAFRASFGDLRRFLQDLASAEIETEQNVISKATKRLIAKAKDIKALQERFVGVA